MSSCTDQADADAWLASSVQDSRVIFALMQLPLTERQSIVRNSRRAHERGLIRAGIDAYVMGGVRRYLNHASPYRAPQAELVTMPSFGAVPQGVSPAVSQGVSPAGSTASASPPVESRSVGSSQCDSERSAESHLARVERSFEIYNHPDFAPSPPEWVRAAFAAHRDRAQVVQHFAGSLHPEAKAALLSLHPGWQHSIAAAAMLSAAAWDDLDAMVLGQVYMHHRLQCGAQSAAASAAPAPPSSKLVVMSIGVGLGVVPLATQVAARAIESKYGAVLQVEEIHEFPTDDLSRGIVNEVSSSLNFDTHLHDGMTNTRDACGVSIPAVVHIGCHWVRCLLPGVFLVSVRACSMLH